MNPKKIALIATLAGLTIATNFAMISLYNVKFMDLIVFVGGYCFGPVVGASIGIVSWSVYGTLNPFGFSIPVWLATMLSESVYGIVGGLIRRIVNPRDLLEAGDRRFRMGIFFGVLSVFLTFVYDFATNVIWGYVSEMNVMVAVVVGFATFGLVHMASNALFFGVACVPSIRALLRVAGGENIGIPEK